MGFFLAMVREKRSGEWPSFAEAAAGRRVVSLRPRLRGKKQIPVRLRLAAQAGSGQALDCAWLRRQARDKRVKSAEVVPHLRRWDMFVSYVFPAFALRYALGRLG